jgi:hypothetical protein
MFVKGQSGNPAGKPKGAKDKKWTKIQYWFELVDDVYGRLDDRHKAQIAMEGFKAMLGRTKLPNQTPEESAEYAKSTLETLKMMESKVITAATKPNGNGTGSNQQG